MSELERLLDGITSTNPNAVERELRAKIAALFAERAAQVAALRDGLEKARNGTGLSFTETHRLITDSATVAREHDARVRAEAIREVTERIKLVANDSRPLHGQCALHDRPCPRRACEAAGRWRDDVSRCRNCGAPTWSVDICGECKQDIRTRRPISARELRIAEAVRDRLVELCEHMARAKDCVAVIRNVDLIAIIASIDAAGEERT